MIATIRSEAAFKSTIHRLFARLMQNEQSFTAGSHLFLLIVSVLRHLSLGLLEDVLQYCTWPQRGVPPMIQALSKAPITLRPWPFQV